MTRRDRLRSLRPEEIRILVTAVVVLPLVVAGLRWAGLARMVRWLSRRPIRTPDRSGPNARTRAETVARTIELAGRHGIVRASCLPCSVLTWWILRREGIETALRIGVKRPGDGLAAHAWVEREGRPLGSEASAPGGFSPFDTDLGRVRDPRI